jgi:hypothetical protein
VADELGWCRLFLTVSDPWGEDSCQDLPPHLQTTSISCSQKYILAVGKEPNSPFCLALTHSKIQILHSFMSSLANWQKNEQKFFVFSDKRTLCKHKNNFGNAPL